MCDFGPLWQSGQETGVMVISGHRKQLPKGAIPKVSTEIVQYSVLVIVCVSMGGVEPLSHRRMEAMTRTLRESLCPMLEN